MSISPSLIWTGFGLTDIGRVRKMNQDTFSIRDDLQLWVLADGMGGQAGGEIASQMAVDTITQYFETPPPLPTPTTHFNVRMNSISSKPWNLLTRQFGKKRSKMMPYGEWGRR